MAKDFSKFSSFSWLIFVQSINVVDPVKNFFFYFFLIDILEWLEMTTFLIDIIQFLGRIFSSSESSSITSDENKD